LTLLAESEQCSLKDVGASGEAREEDVGTGFIGVPHVVDHKHRVLTHAGVPEPVEPRYNDSINNLLEVTYRSDFSGTSRPLAPQMTV